jgi:stage V sporulation protein B
MSNELGATPQESAILFGQWRLALSILVWVEIFVNSGLVKMSIKSIAEQPDNELRLRRATYIGQLAVALVVFVALLVLAGPIAAALGHPELATLLRIAALDIPLYAAFLAASSITLGRGGYERQAIGWIVYSTAKFAIIATVVWLGFSIQGALVGNAASSLVGFAVVFVAWGRGQADLSELTRLARLLLVTSMPFLGLALLEGLAQSADLWLVSALVSSTLVFSYYAFAATLVDMPTFLLVGVNRVLFPSVAQAGAAGDEDAVGRFAVGGLRVAIMITVLAVAVIAATGRQALAFAFQSQAAEAYLPLAILMVASVGRSARSACTEVLMATNRVRLSVIILIGSVIAEVVLLALLAPRWGVSGAAAGAAIAALFSGGWAAFTLRRLLSWRPLFTLLRSAVAAVLVGVALYYVTPANPLWVLFAYPVALVAYLGLLALLREIDSDDVAIVRQAMAR